VVIIDENDKRMKRRVSEKKLKEMREKRREKVCEKRNRTVEDE